MNISEYKQFVSKGYEEAFLSNKYIFRHVSVYLSFLCVKIGISANTITFTSLVFAVIGAYLQVYTYYWVLITSNSLLFMYYILDMVDGEIARYNAKYKNMSAGKSGAYFDALVHYLLSPILFFAVGLFSYNEYHQTFYLWSGLWSGMWISGYSQAAANRVIFDAVLKNREKNEQAIQKIWMHNKINTQVASFRQKIRFGIKELFSTQGQIFTLIICTLLDTIVSFDYSFRTMYLVFFSVIGIVNFPKTSYLFFKRLKHFN